MPAILVPMLGGAVFGGIAGGVIAWARGDDIYQGMIGGAVGGALGVVGGGWLGGLVGSRLAPLLPKTAPMFGPIIENVGLVAGTLYGYSRFRRPDPSTGASPPGGTLPVWDVTQALSGFPGELGPLYMPDQDLRSGAPEYPEQYKFSKTLQAYYEGAHGEGGPSVPHTVLTFWRSFGNPSSVTPLRGPVRVPQAGELLTGDSRFHAEVRRAVQQLSQAFTRLEGAHRQVAAVTQNVAAVSAAGKTAIEQVFPAINEKARLTPQPASKKMDDWIGEYVGAAVNRGAEALNRARTANTRTGADVDALTRQVAELTQRVARLQRQDADRVDRHDRGIDRRLTERDRRLREQDGLRAQLDQFRNQMQQQMAALNAAQTRQFQPDPRLNPPQPAVATPQNASALNGPGGPGGDLMSQMMLRSLLGGGLGNRLDGGRDDRLRDDRRRDERDDRLRDEREELRRERERLRELQLARFNGGPAPLVAAAANPPPPPPPPRLDAPPPDSQAAKNAAPAQGGLTERIPDEDGKVLYTFEDGRQQRVLPIVASALDVACADNAGTNAQAAYKDPPAKWDDDKQIGKPVDPSQLMTGDVCRFENGTAIAVVWGSPDSGGTLELVIDGQLRAFSPDSKDTKSLGDFTGFFHPNIGQGAPGGARTPALVSAETQGAPMPVAG